MSCRSRIVTYKQHLAVSSFPKCAFYWINYPLAYLMFVSKEQLQAASGHTRRCSAAS